MPSIKSEYFIKGVDHQKRPDIKFEIKRCEIKKLIDLGNEEKAKIIDFLEGCKLDIQHTIDRLKS